MFHREGSTIIGITILILLLLNWAVLAFCAPCQPWLAIGSGIVLVLVLQFFRNPNRPVPKPDERLVYSPADGKVVVIETVEEPEYFKDKRLMISIFMSPLNVHVNRVPLSGTISYRQDHPGKYLAAWHPKSSTENERNTVVINTGREEVLIRQIAGAVARRIVTYPKSGEVVKQGDELGFIKFGSRADIFLPLNAEVQVSMGQAVKGNLDAIARLNG